MRKSLLAGLAFPLATAISSCGSSGGGSGIAIPIDTTPPSIAVLAPTGADPVEGTIAIGATAADDTGVAAVQFTIDGEDFGPLLTHPPWRLEWNTTSAPDGVHVVSAHAWDTAHNEGDSPEVGIVVENVPAAPGLAHSTFLGGLDVDTIRDAFVDAAGNVYVAGGTASADFPTTHGAYDRTFNGVHDAFVAKFAANGALVWSTLLGGPNYDRAYAVEVDAQGFVYVAGRAGEGFPTTPGALQTGFGGDLNPTVAYGAQDGFVAKLAPDGGSLVWSTYFGNDDGSSPRDMGIDAAGDVYVVLATGRPHYAVTPGSFQPVLAGPNDGLVAEISADGAHVVWGSYFGGSATDGGTPSMRVGADGTVWVLGQTQSDDFPVSADAYQRTRGGSVDLVLLKIAPGGGTLAWATYFGGSGVEFTETHGLSVDAHGVATIAATTLSTDLPFVPASIPPSFQPLYGGSGGPGTGAQTNYSGDGFVARISADGAKLLAFTYLGGSAGEGIEGVATDAAGRVFVSGGTYSPDFPVTPDAVQRVKKAVDDAFLARLSSDLSTLQFGTFLGAGGEEEARTVAVGANGAAWVVGMTASPGFPTTPGAQQPVYGGGAFDGFIFAVDP